MPHRHASLLRLATIASLALSLACFAVAVRIFVTPQVIGEGGARSIIVRFGAYVVTALLALAAAIVAERTRRVEAR